MAVVAFANLKGGVGKSTLAINVAGALAPSSVLVDADPQGTSTAWAEPGVLPFQVVAVPLKTDVKGWIARVLALDADFVVIDLPPMLGRRRPRRWRSAIWQRSRFPLPGRTWPQPVGQFRWWRKPGKRAATESPVPS